jgi:hypothetical protein
VNAYIEIPRGERRKFVMRGNTRAVDRIMPADKRHDPKGFSNVPGWSSPEDRLAHIVMTHAFFLAVPQVNPFSLPRRSLSDPYKRD